MVDKFNLYIFLSLVSILTAVLLGMFGPISHIEDVPCYDNRGNEIVGLVCENEARESWVMILGTFLVIASVTFFLLSFNLLIKEFGRVV